MRSIIILNDNGNLVAYTPVGRSYTDDLVNVIFGATKLDRRTIRSTLNGILDSNMPIFYFNTERF